MVATASDMRRKKTQSDSEVDVLDANIHASKLDTCCKFTQHMDAMRVILEENDVADPRSSLQYHLGQLYAELVGWSKLELADISTPCLDYMINTREDRVEELIKTGCKCGGHLPTEPTGHLVRCDPAPLQHGQDLLYSEKSRRLKMQTLGLDEILDEITMKELR